MTDKIAYRIIAAVSLVVFLAVGVLNRKLIHGPEHIPPFVTYLPKLNAILNGTCCVLLLISFYFIKQKRIIIHKRLNIVAFCLSSIFLASYILLHFFAPETLFGDTNGDGVVSQAEAAAAGNIRYVYYVILSSHIILAAAVLPLVLISFYRGLQMQVEKHKKIVRWSYPIWLYVTITGVVVYLMISPYYHF